MKIKIGHLRVHRLKQNDSQNIGTKMKFNLKFKLKNNNNFFKINKLNESRYIFGCGKIQTYTL